MVHTCAVHGCSNRANASVNRGFYSFPIVRKHEGVQTEEISQRRRNEWIARINRKNFQPSRHTKVCSDHFVQGKPASLYDTTHPDWAPSLKLCSETVRRPAARKSTVTLGRYERRQDRKLKQERLSVADALLQLSTSLVGEDEQPVQRGTNLPIELPEEKRLETPAGRSESCDSTLCAQTGEECQQLRTENFDLKQKLRDTKLTMESFKGNDKIVKFYTGLPSFVTLMTLFNFLKEYIPESTRIELNKFQKLLLVLMKLRQNFPVQDLAYRFGISQSTVSRTFSSVIHVMFVRLQRYIYWPMREELRLSMPMEFRKHFGLKVCVIVDCFEIFIERPSNLFARSRTWSSYKHHNTIKFLIGITPQGSVCFLSRAWGGRTSDKHVTENSPFLDKLLPGDIVLADRGFDIHESVGLRCAEVKIPSFTKGKAQLSALEIESTRSIAHIRIHVERVIGLVRNKYTILSATLPIDYLMSSGGDLPLIDKIATVCCCLTNLCASVVPFN